MSMSAGAQTRRPAGGDDVFITYLDQSDSFALGVEFGEFLSALGQGYEAVGGYFSARLEAQLLVAASRLGYVRETWIERGDGSCLGQFRRTVGDPF
jgi:hypothetical protein